MPLEMRTMKRKRSNDVPCPRCKTSKHRRVQLIRNPINQNILYARAVCIKCKLEAPATEYKDGDGIRAAISLWCHEIGKRKRKHAC